MKIDRLLIEVKLAESLMTPRKLAELSGVDVSTIRRAMYGGSIRPTTAGKIAQALGVPVSNIVRGVNET